MSKEAMTLREEAMNAYLAVSSPHNGVKECSASGMDAAIAIVLERVGKHLSAVQYDPAPYTALKYRLAGLQSKAGQEQ